MSAVAVGTPEADQAAVRLPSGVATEPTSSVSCPRARSRPTRMAGLLGRAGVPVEVALLGQRAVLVEHHRLAERRTTPRSWSRKAASTYSGWVYVDSVSCHSRSWRRGPPTMRRSGPALSIRDERRSWAAGSVVGRLRRPRTRCRCRRTADPGVDALTSDVERAVAGGDDGRGVDERAGAVEPAARVVEPWVDRRWGRRRAAGRRTDAHHHRVPRRRSRPPATTSTGRPSQRPRPQGFASFLGWSFLECPRAGS